jgi:hypothetical protein
MGKSVVYFASDLSDMAVNQRVRMLLAGGAEVRLLGFRRTDTPIHAVAGVAATDLGRTFEGQLVKRVATVLRTSLTARRMRDLLDGADVVLARNLDMLTIANASRGRRSIPLVYECLDIHRALLGSGLPSKLLRNWEKRLLGKVSGLVVSSPGFVTNYFKQLGVDLPPVILTENKQVLSNEPVSRPANRMRSGPPWKIGWFGNIRCIESFHLLLEFARRCPDLVEIDLRGRPTGVLQDLINQYLPLPNMRFGGAYTHDDLATMYNHVHFMWGIDYHQRGNSDWLLPNRIYEAGRYNCPIIALANTQTAVWLNAHGAGVMLDDPQSGLEPFIKSLSLVQYVTLQRAVTAIPTDDLVHTVASCRRFVNELINAHHQIH